VNEGLLLAADACCWLLMAAAGCCLLAGWLSFLFFLIAVCMTCFRWRPFFLLLLRPSLLAAAAASATDYLPLAVAPLTESMELLLLS